MAREILFLLCFCNNFRMFLEHIEELGLLSHNPGIKITKEINIIKFSIMI